MMAANAKMSLAVWRDSCCRDRRRLADPCQAAAAHRASVAGSSSSSATSSSLASPRPFVVAGSLMVSAALLKARHGSEEKSGIGQNPGLNWVLAQPEEI